MVAQRVQDLHGRLTLDARPQLFRQVIWKVDPVLGQGRTHATICSGASRWPCAFALNGSQERVPVRWRHSRLQYGHLQLRKLEDRPVARAQRSQHRARIHCAESPESKLCKGTEAGKLYERKNCIIWNLQKKIQEMHAVYLAPKIYIVYSIGIHIHTTHCSFRPFLGTLIFYLSCKNCKRATSFHVVSGAGPGTAAAATGEMLGDASGPAAAVSTLAPVRFWRPSKYPNAKVL